MNEQRRGSTARRWATWLAVAYLGLAGIEATRLLLLRSPPPPDEGLYDWEGQELPGGEVRRFRWTGAQASLRRPIAAPVLELPLFMSRPDISTSPVTLRIEVDGATIDTVRIDVNGWQHRAYYLPPLLGRPVSAEAGVEADAPAGARAGNGVGEADPARAGNRVGWRELQPWAPAGSDDLTLAVATESTFVPSRSSRSRDDRELGVAIGVLAWEDALGPAGVGLHEPERSGDGRSFRWTARPWASMPLVAGAEAGTLYLRVDHPDLDERPVRVTLYWDHRRLHAVELTDTAWTAVTLEPGGAPGETGVLSVHVDRTWRPADFGSVDARRLGVALTDVEWR